MNFLKGVGFGRMNLFYIAEVTLPGNFIHATTALHMTSLLLRGGIMLSLLLTVLFVRFVSLSASC